MYLRPSSRKHTWQTGEGELPRLQPGEEGGGVPLPARERHSIMYLPEAQRSGRSGAGAAAPGQRRPRAATAQRGQGPKAGLLPQVNDELLRTVRMRRGTRALCPRDPGARTAIRVPADDERRNARSECAGPHGARPLGAQGEDRAMAIPEPRTTRNSTKSMIWSKLTKFDTTEFGQF